MDLRSVTLDDVRGALMSWSKTLQTLRATKHPGYDRMVREMNSGKITWIDPRTDLFLAFEVRGDKAELVTTYWKNGRDPKPVRPSECPR